MDATPSTYLMNRDGLLAELACDGAWTARQLRNRAGSAGNGSIEPYVTHTIEALRRTAWARNARAVEVVRLNARGLALAAKNGVTAQTIRAGELEHALGLAELRWRCGALHERYIAQDTFGREHRRAIARGERGFGDKLADGALTADGGVVLCEYDHGRYSAEQIGRKLSAFRQMRRLNGRPVLGAVWGAPTERRAAWLRAQGVSDVIVLEPSTWLA